jgi:hypothetical protein
MPVAGLLASCPNCPAETSVVVGPLYAPVFGQLTTCARAVDAAPIVDATGVSRMAPVTSYDLRPDELLTFPSGRPGCGKSYTAMEEMMRTLEENREERKVYFVKVPFKLLAASHVVTFNRLFWATASESLKDAYRRYGYIPSQPTDEERDARPFRHYETVETAELSSDGGHVVTTGNSWHRFSSIVNGVDRYGRSKVGYVIIDELESLPKLIMDPALVNNSCIENNLVALFEALRLSQRGVPVACLDGFATDDISGRVMRAAGTPFAELRCNAGIFNGRKLTYILDYVSTSNRSNLGDSDSSPKRFLLVHTSVGGMIGRIIASMDAGRNPQVFCSSKMQLYAIVNIVRKHFSNAPREVFIVTSDTPAEFRLRANAAAGGHLSEGETFGAIFTTSAVGGGLNFTITRDVFAIVYRNQANGQEVWQTYLRSRNLEHIYVCTWRSDGLWDARLHDSFEPATDYVKWMVKARRPRPRPRPPAPRAPRAPLVVRRDEVSSHAFNPHLPRRVALDQDAHELEDSCVANDADAGELLDHEPVTTHDNSADADLARELDVARHHRNSSAPAEITVAQEALDEALKKCKTAALEKGKKVAKSLTEYHRLRRLRETLRGVIGAEHLDWGGLGGGGAHMHHGTARAQPRTVWCVMGVCLHSRNFEI